MSKKKKKIYQDEFHCYDIFSGKDYRNKGCKQYENECSPMHSKLIYALALLVLIVLQFGKPQTAFISKIPEYCEDCPDKNKCFPGLYKPGSSQLIDNSVLFIIVFFLLIACSGCLPRSMYR